MKKLTLSMIILSAMITSYAGKITVDNTPGSAAQAVADRMVASGVRVILNFAPTRVTVPREVIVRNVDLTQELQILCYYLPETTAAEK